MYEVLVELFDILQKVSGQTNTVGWRLFFRGDIFPSSIITISVLDRGDTSDGRNQTSLPSTELLFMTWPYMIWAVSQLIACCFALDLNSTIYSLSNLKMQHNMVKPKEIQEQMREQKAIGKKQMPIAFWTLVNHNEIQYPQRKHGTLFNFPRSTGLPNQWFIWEIKDP